MSKVYVTQEVFNQAEIRWELSFYDREFEDDAEIPHGYFLAHPHLVVLPFGAICEKIDCKVSLPKDLCYPIFKQAPNLPEGFRESIEYWTPHSAIGRNDPSAIYYQSPDHSYFINLDGNGEVPPKDEMISEMVVIKIEGIENDMIPLDVDYLCFRVWFDKDCMMESVEPYNVGTEYNNIVTNHFEEFYLRVTDILNRPTKDIYLDVLAPNMLDYGYYY